MFRRHPTQITSCLLHLANCTFSNSPYLQEVEQLKKALQKDEFRKLLVEYAKEISDPENRKRYEKEIAQLERDRGQEVKFLHPEVSSIHLSHHMLVLNVNLKHVDPPTHIYVHT